MAASTVPAAKQAVLNLLTARPALNEVPCTWGEPTEQEDLADEFIYFEGPTVRRPNWGSLGGAPIDEEYELVLTVKNRVFDDDRSAAETRCWALVAEVEQALRADLRLGSILRVPLDFGEQEHHTAALSDGWFGVATVPLICTARI